MELLGKIKNREIFYISIRGTPDWLGKLPTEKWIAFTIANREDEELLHDSTTRILDKNVTYTCSAGELCSLTEDYFHEEIGWRGVQNEEKTGQKFDFDSSPMTTMHHDFEEGLWFASTSAYDGEKEMNKVVCIDFTQRKVKMHLKELVKEINAGWLPSHGKNGVMKYDIP